MVPGLHIYNSMISLSEITHQMWYDHPFSQKTTHQKWQWRSRLEAVEKRVRQNFKKVWQGILGSLHNIRDVRSPLPTMTHKQLFWEKDVLMVQVKSLKRLDKEFIFSNVTGQKPVTLQKMSSITGIFEEFCLKFPEHVLHRIHFSGFFLKLYHSQHCLTEVLRDFDIYLDLLLLHQTQKVW